MIAGVITNWCLKNKTFHKLRHIAVGRSYPSCKAYLHGIQATWPGALSATASADDYSARPKPQLQGLATPTRGFRGLGFRFKVLGV